MFVGVLPLPCSPTPAPCQGYSVLTRNCAIYEAQWRPRGQRGRCRSEFRDVSKPRGIGFLRPPAGQLGTPKVPRTISSPSTRPAVPHHAERRPRLSLTLGRGVEMSRSAFLQNNNHFPGSRKPGPRPGCPGSRRLGRKHYLSNVIPRLVRGTQGFTSRRVVEGDAVAGMMCACGAIHDTMSNVGARGTLGPANEPRGDNERMVSDPEFLTPTQSTPRATDCSPYDRATARLR